MSAWIGSTTRRGNETIHSPQILLILLAACTLATPPQVPAQAPAKPDIVPPPLSTIMPLKIGPARDPRDQIELSPLSPMLDDVEHPLLFEIAIFKIEPLPQSQTRGHDPLSSSYYTSYTGVSTDGTVGYGDVSGDRWFRRGMGPTGATPIPPDLFAKIKSLLSSLPDDRGRVPPRNHKVQIEIATPTGTRKRMYDEANLPEAMLEILWLTGSNFTPTVPKFAPSTQSKQVPWRPSTAPTPDTILAVSHDRQFTVAIQGGVSRIREIDTQLAREIAAGREHAEVDSPGWPPPSPEVKDSNGRSVCKIPPLPMFVGRISRYIDLLAVWFTPDDKYVVLSTSIPAIRIYEKKNCQQVENIPAIPAGALDFEPAPDWKHAIVVFLSGEIDLWDVESQHSVSRIDLGGFLNGVSWAPDNQRVAVSTVENRPQRVPEDHLRVWNTQSGKLQHELLAFSRQIDPPSLWWPDGKYLLASTGGGVSIWNVGTGRYGGSFTSGGCYSGFPLISLEEGRLTMDCPYQTPTVWDAGSAIQKVVAFESSLEK